MAEFTEQQVYEALGLGAQAQEPAEPAGGTSQPGNETAPAEGEGKPGTQTPEERRANAARRRQQEQQAAVDAAVKAERERHDAQMEQFFRDANLKNTITGQPITSMQQFLEWKTAFDAKRTEQALKSGKMTPETLNEAISRHPVVQKAQQVIDQAEQTAKQQRDAADRARIDNDLAEIRKLDPSITSVSDLLAADYAEGFKANVKKGMSLLEAFKLANFDRLTSAKADAARQQAMNQSRGKDHLTPIGTGRGDGSLEVPPAEMRYFHSLMPGKTDSQIREFYNKHKKTK